MTLAIVGGGSWGTALAIVLAGRFHRVCLWVHNPELAEQISQLRENRQYLPGIPVPSNVCPTSDIPSAVSGADLVLTVVPSRFLRGAVQSLMPHLRKGTSFVSATKGIEPGTLARMSEVIRDVAGASTHVAVLSGPTFAREVAEGHPAAVVIAADSESFARHIQQQFSGPSFRLYTNNDTVGVEIGAALKNVIAIGAGIVSGSGLGSNTVAALVTRGLAEITRLAVAAGGEQSTLAGLAGLGDLLLTCTGELSRNRRVGIQLAEGRTLEEAIASGIGIAEGVDTTAAALALARRLGVEMPITEQMDLVLRERKPPREAIRHLMDRRLRRE
ncbi:MAG: NAD(P)-dependent glycerol-3-phosphate dehydrogenase [Bryobacteraceae bacterium]|nr:NAD(P)-dependent glycerol-3-phosphate dehydrogenase [Bryobacteraceae bacterium]